MIIYGWSRGWEQWLCSALITSHPQSVHLIFTIPVTSCLSGGHTPVAFNHATASLLRSLPDRHTRILPVLRFHSRIMSPPALSPDIVWNCR
ncbi:hypothetical protein BJ165DRAFT_749651 [Panaeolus papilionaceus]|nr:hypothetical protein BJ165DRAFT_749651 [Panaeolus papilionaceus]